MKLCLIIVFNHRFDRNLPRLRQYYAGKFRKIIFLMPFADDLKQTEPDVISVHHNSHLFQGFFGEARRQLEQIECDGYVVAGDDLLINPVLNEENLHARLGLNPGDGYIKDLVSLYDVALSWSRLRTTYRAFFADGLEWQRLLPPATVAFAKSERYGIRHRSLGLRNISSLLSRQGISSLATAFAWFAERNPTWKFFACKNSEIPYPAFVGYSDFLVIPKSAWPAFGRYCEATAAMQLFVESAIPLAMVLACENVKTELEGGTQIDAPSRKRRMRGIEMQCNDRDREAFEQAFSLDLDRLIREFPEDVLYYHPVKLSKWQGLHLSNQS